MKRSTSNNSLWRKFYRFAIAFRVFRGETMQVIFFRHLIKIINWKLYGNCARCPGEARKYLHENWHVWFKWVIFQLAGSRWPNALKTFWRNRISHKSLVSPSNYQEPDNELGAQWHLLIDCTMWRAHVVQRSNRRCGISSKFTHRTADTAGRRTVWNVKSTKA